MKKTTTKRGRPRKEKNWTPKNLKESAGYYFEKCNSRTKEVLTKDGFATVEDPAPYTVEGLCNHLGITVVTFRNWRGKGNELGKTAEMLHQKIIENRVTGALDGRQNASFARFMLTNNAPDQYREKVEVENSVSDQLKSVFDLLAGYANKSGEDS